MCLHDKYNGEENPEVLLARVLQPAVLVSVDPALPFQSGSIDPIALRRIIRDNGRRMASLFHAVRDAPEKLSDKLEGMVSGPVYPTSGNEVLRQAAAELRKIGK